MRCLVWVVVCLTLPAVPAFSQASTATVGGTVRDQSGAVVPRAPVVLLNTATNVRSQTAANDLGFYMIPGVVPGTYRLEVEFTGMQKFEALVTVQVQQNVVIDPVLKPAATSTSVVIQDVTPMVTVDSPTLGHVLERNRIEQLPINGRDFASLLVTVPGMESMRAYGEREGAMEITLDGSPLFDRVRARSQIRPPGLDTIQEFKVETNSSSAKFTRPTTVVLSTRSGTNDFHGTLFETHRNNGIGKARTRTDTYSKPPQLIRNEFGGTAGGPVMLPGAYDGRNRTFWFYSFEGARRVSASTKSYQIPTDAMWNGDFSNLKDSQGRLYTLYNPWTTDPKTFQRQPFNYGGKLNVIDPARLSPVYKYLGSITPRPNRPEVNPLVDDNWWGPVRSEVRNWTTTFRLDHRFNDTNSFYARYTQGAHRDWSPGNYGIPMADQASNGLQQTAPNRTLALSWVRTVSPTFFNEALASVTRERYYAGNKAEKNWAGMLGLPNPFGSPSFPVINQPGFPDLKWQPHNMNGSFNTYYMLDDNVTKIAGRHELQFGAHTRWDYVNLLPDQQATAGSLVPIANGTALWDPSGTLASPLSVARTGYGFGSLAIGTAQYMIRLNHGMFYGRSREYALYFQDNFRVTSRLTLNLGLRWELWPAYTEKYGNMTSFDMKARALVMTQPIEQYYKMNAALPAVVDRIQELGGKFVTYDQVGYPRKLIHGNYKDFGPRLGFAYRTAARSRAAVLRGGYRISYFPIPMRVWSEYTRSSLPFTSYLYYNVEDSAQSPDGLRAWSLRNVPTVIAGVNSKDVINPFGRITSISRGSNTNANFFSPDLPDTRVQDWNFTVEKELMADTVGKISYVGNHVSHLEQFVDHNPATPGFVWYSTRGTPLPSGEYGSVATRAYDQTVWGAVQEYGKFGWSNFNGVQMELERRYNKGVGFQLFYVVGDAFTAGGRTWSNPMMPTNVYMPGIVPEDFKARTRFLLYQRDTSVPKHRVRWNWIADLPVGKGKLLARGAGGLLDRIIGGWQVAGMGSLRSTYASLPTTVWPTGDNIEMYGYKYPIEDCRSGRCYPGYLWWNGYIPANRINSYDPKTGKPNGVMGVPDSYKPAAKPLIPWGSTALPPNAPANTNVQSYWDSNTVWIPMKNGSVQRTTYSPGDHPWRNQFFPSTRQWGVDASLFKTIPIRESLKIRFNADFFNIFNHPGNPSGVGSDGILATRSSGWGARELQLTVRVTW